MLRDELNLNCHFLPAFLLSKYCEAAAWSSQVRPTDARATVVGPVREAMERGADSASAIGLFSLREKKCCPWFHSWFSLCFFV